MNDDDELIADFLGEYSDAQIEMEKILENWEQSDNSNDSVNILFRAAHSIKSNLRMMQCEALSDTIHILEDLLTQLREKQRQLIPGFTILISATLEQCKELSKQTLTGLDRSNETKILSTALSDLSLSPNTHFEQSLFNALQVIDQIGAYGNDYGCESLINFLKHEEISNNDDFSEQSVVNNELEFFFFLINQIESHFPFWQGRSDKILILVNQMNEFLDCPVDPNQLQAAVYMHDIGMSFVPPQKIYSTKSLSENDRHLMHSHCELGFQWLNMIPGWDDAAKMIIQHHERYDGKGYPFGLAAEQICDGAKLLAIGDAYASITGQQKNGSHDTPIEFAMMEISQGSGHQFDPQWTRVFDQVIRLIEE